MRIRHCWAGRCFSNTLEPSLQILVCLSGSCSKPAYPPNDNKGSFWLVATTYGLGGASTGKRPIFYRFLVLFRDWAGCILRDSGREHILVFLPRLAYGILTAQLLHRLCNGMLMFTPAICVYQSGPLPLSRRIRVFVVIRRNLPLNCESKNLPDVGRKFLLIGFRGADFRHPLRCHPPLPSDRLRRLTGSG